jgi:hypothetical protein
MAEEKTKITTACPDEERLASFVDGLPGGTDRESVVAHVDDCGDCLDRVVMARFADEQERSLVGAAFPTGMAQRAASDRAKALFRGAPVLEAVFRLGRGALEVIRSAGVEWAPVAAPAVRGASESDSKDLWETSAEVGGLRLSLEVERTGAGCVIAAGVASLDGTDPPAGTSLALVRDADLIALQPASAEPADLAEVGPGRFHVEVRRDGSPTGHATLRLDPGNPAEVQ